MDNCTSNCDPMDELLVNLNIKYEEILEDSDEIYKIDVIMRMYPSLTIENGKTLIEIWEEITL